ncbi:bifunctional phosphopantothenoylcysteine decarboxylase/phosphopantothenate--cysteine ligase CoaBC [Sarcina sp. JB2]|uniref:Bifunctional phosphopantothenoylcysteine decarboxylase/phosphopantothenate--cysteine ligase CoaBC n=1 Tax=Candidatus Sarcina troglodytae TaxID=2726954 RepID=A0ACD1BE95_9CLOT|nr:bifunctional phosphopantothenoylcysteine decarboxylase/phosphopantothenate--cysteine ligase CoaBC [Sarcina sp. JB2]QPJ85688.1 bifunctional phosphopantothenoylcysteine decarboxylase/phosphopantothenate--cysteine ligase CoaBC [Sarcina sp. JB2]
MNNKKVLLGVSGGIAVYKALDVISRLKKKGIEVKVIMTKSATEFVTPLSFQSLSENPVVINMFDEPKAWEIQHISLAKWADLVVVVPATANIIGKVANGIADDMLSTTIMATKAEVIFCPAMNTNMYENKIVQKNMATLKDLGYGFINPASGRLACGDIGRGKLENTEIIAEKIIKKLSSKSRDFEGKNVLVTAGPTIVPIDPVRYLTNRSTGKMGYEIAKEARDRGANVTLISGPTSLDIPTGINFIKVNTNEEMLNAVLDNFNDSNIVVKSAAVADFNVKEYSKEKIKKTDSNLVIELERDKDILETLGKQKTNQIIVGFAAESSNVIENAKAKLKRKNIDYIVANDITSNDTGFASDDNKVTIISSLGDVISLDKMSKREVAKNIFDMIKGR